VDRFACDWPRLATTDPKDSTGNDYIVRDFITQYFFPEIGKKQEKFSVFLANQGFFCP
jgi:hypothetical protein